MYHVTAFSWMTVLFLLAFCNLAFGQNTTLPPIQSQNAKDAIEAFDLLKKDLDEKLESHRERVRTDYLARLAQLKDDLLSKLKAARDEEAKKVNLDEANAIQRAITDYEAAELIFPTIGSSSPSPASSTLAFPVGQWSGNWGSGEQVSLVINKDDTISGRWKLQKVDGRMLAIDSQNQLQLELIPYSNRLVVLGWTGIKEDHFKKGEEDKWLTHSPGSVALLRKMEIVQVGVTNEVNRFSNGNSPVSNKSTYSLDGNGHHGVLDLGFQSNQLNWKKAPISADLYYYVSDAPTSETPDEVLVYAGKELLGKGRAPTRGKWYHISLDTSKLQPARVYVLQMRLNGANALGVQGMVTGKGPYLELVFDK